MLHDLLPKTVEGALAVLGGWLGLIWSATLQNVAPLAWWFAIFVIADLITGVWAGIKTTGFSSKTLYSGMVKKGIAFFIIILAHGLDVSFWRTAAASLGRSWKTSSVLDTATRCRPL